jgi:hypothetical protein
MADGSEVVEIEAWANDGDLHAVQLKTAKRGSHWVRFTSGAGLSLIAALRRLIASSPLGTLTLTVTASQASARADERKAIMIQTQELGPIALELSEEAIAILQKQLAELRAIQHPQSSH